MIFRKLVAAFTALSFLVSGMIVPAQAAMMGTGQYLQAGERHQHLASIDVTLMRADVQQQLAGLGVSLEDAKARIARLPDNDVAVLATELESLPAGSDLLGVIGVVFVVLLILEITGVIDIFKRI